MLAINVIVMILILIGAINWGFVGFFNYNFVNAIFGGNPEGEYTVLLRVIFAIVGLAGIWGLSYLGKVHLLSCCRRDESCNQDDKKD